MVKGSKGVGRGGEPKTSAGVQENTGISLYLHFNYCLSGSLLHLALNLRKYSKLT